ncbi:HNH endonuclease [Paludibaculum fermentans]|uniref:HNH endonuclease n=1 Tax=Paludibaculum fermentans TaxID=1473598 RepID=UPI003EC13285
MPEFLERQRTPENYWRAVILFGLNVASYKFALAKSLIELAVQEREFLKLEELAEPFSRHIVDHLSKAPKQATSGSSRFLESCKGFANGTVSKDQLIGQTSKLGFNNVIDAFHIVNRGEIPIRFFVDERNNGGIRLTEELHRLVERVQFENLPHEVEARWRLVETAWQLRVARAALNVHVDGEMLVTVVGGRRANLTSCRDALNGYQKGKCFYCFNDISVASTSAQLADVDHFHPRMLVQSGVPLNWDGVWNLVLSCRDCNRGVDGKSSRLAHQKYLERLDTRNEFFITSHHPLRETLMAQTGGSRAERHDFLNSAYSSAWEWLIHTWQPRFEHESAF